MAALVAAEESIGPPTQPARNGRLDIKSQPARARLVPASPLTGARRGPGARDACAPTALD